MTQEEALRMALEALKMIDEAMPFPVAKLAQTAIKESLAQEQEPVAWADHGVVNWIADKQFRHEADLYTTPPQRECVGLTDEEIEQLHIAWVLGGGFRQLCNAIEETLKKKNH